MPHQKKEIDTFSPWTEKELALLREEYPLRGPAWVAGQLGRTAMAVRLKASRLGIRRKGVLSPTQQRRYEGQLNPRSEHFLSAYLPAPPPNTLENHRTPWSKQEDETLEQYYTTHGTLYTAAILGRTPDATQGRAQILAIPGFDTARLERFLETVGDRLDRVEESIRKRREQGVPPFVLNANQKRRVMAVLDRHPFNEIAASCGADEEELLYFLLQQGLLPKPYSAPWTGQEEKELRQMWGRLSVSEIATELRRTPFAIRKKSREVIPSLKRRLWTKREDAQLRRDYGRIPTREIAEKLNRSHVAVQSRAQLLRLGIVKRQKLTAWTKQEDDLLRRLKSTHTTNEQIAEQLPGRTVTAVRSRAISLGIVRNIWQPWEDEKLRELHGKKSRAEIAEVLGRTPGAVETHARRLGLKPTGPRRYRWDRAHDKELIRLSKTMSTRELSEKYGVPSYLICAQQKRLKLR